MLYRSEVKVNKHIVKKIYAKNVKSFVWLEHTLTHNNDPL